MQWEIFSQRADPQGRTIGNSQIQCRFGMSIGDLKNHNYFYTSKYNEESKKKKLG
jgi:hypothetical protein